MNRLLVPGAVALAGIASLALLVPRFDPSTPLHAVLDRDAAIARTRAYASSHGVNTSGWRATVAESLAAPTGPLKIRVELKAPAGKPELEIAWYPDGSMASSRLPGEARAKAPEVAAVDANDQGTVHVHVNTQAPPAREKLNYLPVRIVGGLWYTAILGYFAWSALRRRVSSRLALMLAALVLVSVAAGFFGGTGFQKSRMSSDADVSDQSHFGSVFWIFLYAGAGFSLRTAVNRQKWSSIELAARGGFFSRQVGWPLAAGLASGIGIAAIPYLVAATGLFRGSRLVFGPMELLVAPIPALVAWDLSAGVLAVGIFGLTVPLLSTVRRPALRWLLIAVLGIGALGTTFRPFSTPGANLLASTLVFGAYLLLYLRTDVLATVAAMIAAQAAIGPFLLLSQAGGSVRTLAVPLLLVWGVALATTFNFAIRGREGVALPAAPSLEPVEEVETRTGRMRLEAEFEVARKAQDGALPAAPPELKGYSLAGSCQPAQQVGGDLYDFFPLADGRLGIAVADVSGKGVPAALYMMVTKGLLAATTRESSDLAYILQQVNLHLYRACRKKVFVTLAAVALDPEKRRIQHGRAGHNPILWRRSARRETVVLKPAGLALGMTPGERFNRTLKIEELELEPGDAIVLYSDGITEAVDSRMEQFGDQRLAEAVESTDGKPADASRAAILRRLADFVGTTPARDDITLVVLRVAGNGVLI